MGAVRKIEVIISAYKPGNMCKHDLAEIPKDKSDEKVLKLFENAVPRYTISPVY